MRWNETPIVAFNIDAMTAPERVVSGEGIGGADCRRPSGGAHPRVHVFQRVGRRKRPSAHHSALTMSSDFCSSPSQNERRAPGDR
jgi:hypothetical protein